MSKWICKILGHKPAFIWNHQGTDKAICSRCGKVIELSWDGWK